MKKLFLIIKRIFTEHEPLETAQANRLTLYRNQVRGKFPKIRWKQPTQIKIDGKTYHLPYTLYSAAELLQIAGHEWQRYDLQIKFKGGQRKFIHQLHAPIKIQDPAIDRFETIPLEATQGAA